MTKLGPFDPVRVIKKNGDSKVTITENGNPKKPFSELTSRYVISYKVAEAGDSFEGVVTISYKGQGPRVNERMVTILSAYVYMSVSIAPPRMRMAIYRRTVLQRLFTRCDC